MNHSNYGYSKKVKVAFEQAVKYTKEALIKEEFGVLTEIDIKPHSKKRLM